MSDILKKANLYQILFCANIFFHKVGFANPTLWKKANYYFVKNWSIYKI